MTNPGVLVVTDDPALLQEVQRSAAGAGLPLQQARDAGVALAHWSSAAAVLVGADLAVPLGRASPRRRPHVHLVCLGEADELHFRAAVDVGAESVLAHAAQSGVIADLLAERAEPRPPGQVVAVVPGSGGAGASTLACALAQAAAARGRALVVDCDPRGAGVDRILGLESQLGLRWKTLAASPGRISGESLRTAVPRRGELGLLTWGGASASRPISLEAATVRDVVEAARRVHDLVVVDLPRGDDDVVREVVARSDRVLLVVRPTVTGVAAAARQLGALDTRVGLVVRGRGVGLDSLARSVGAEVLAQMGDQRGLDEAVDLGLGPLRSLRSPLGRAAIGLLDALDDDAGRRAA